MNEELRVPARALEQKGTKLYMFSMNSQTLRHIAYVFPKSRDNPQMIQRKLEESRLRNIGDFIKKEDSLFPNNIVLNLSGDVTFVPSDDPRLGTLVFPSQESKVGYILDGQHRLYGFGYSGGIEFDLPVVALLNAPHRVAYKIFADINSKQEKVTNVLLQLLYKEIGELEKGAAEIAVPVVHDLNNDTDSVLQGKIKIFPEDKGTWITAPTLSQFITPIVGIGAPLQSHTRNEQTTILKNYFKAFKQSYPEAWSERKNYILTKAMGFNLMCGLFDRIYRRCQLYETGLMEVDAIKRQLRSMADIKLLEDSEPIPFNWASDPFGRFSSRVGLKALRNMLLLALPERDQKD